MAAGAQCGNDEACEFGVELAVERQVVPIAVHAGGGLGIHVVDRLVEIRVDGTAAGQILHIAGRRRFLILLGVPTLLVTILMFVPGMPVWAYFLVYALWIIANQLIMTPYSVLPNEMTTDFNGRTMLSTTRMLFSGISTAVIPLGMAAFLNALGDKKSSSYTISMGFFIVLFAVFVFIAYKSTWELTPEEAGFYEAALEAEPLKPVFGWIFAELGPRKMFSLNFAGAIIGLLGLWGLWQTAAQNSTAVWNAMLYVVMVWWLIFRAMTWFIPWNVFPFIPDVDMIMAGENRGGLYIGFQQFARKITAGLPAMAWGWYLGANGFVEEAFKAGGKKADVEPETKKIVEQLTGIKYEKCWPQTAE